VQGEREVRDALVLCLAAVVLAIGGVLLHRAAAPAAPATPTEKVLPAD